MFQIPMSQPDPAQHMRRYHSRERRHEGEQVAGPSTSRAGSTRTTTRPIDAAEGETDPVKRAALYIKANDIMMQDTSSFR